MSSISIVSTISRVASGWLADRKFINRCVLYYAAHFICALAVLSLFLWRHYALILIASLVYALTTGKFLNSITKYFRHNSSCENFIKMRQMFIKYCIDIKSSNNNYYNRQFKSTPDKLHKALNNAETLDNPNSMVLYSLKPSGTQMLSSVYHFLNFYLPVSAMDLFSSFLYLWLFIYQFEENQLRTSSGSDSIKDWSPPLEPWGRIAKRETTKRRHTSRWPAQLQTPLSPSEVITMQD